MNAEQFVIYICSSNNNIHTKEIMQKIFILLHIQLFSKQDVNIICIVLAESNRRTISQMIELPYFSIYGLFFFFTFLILPLHSLWSYLFDKNRRRRSRIVRKTAGKKESLTSVLYIRRNAYSYTNKIGGERERESLLVRFVLSYMCVMCAVSMRNTISS